MTGPFVTDTSTLAIFDPEALCHRLHDDDDWWTYPDDDVLSEINNGNVGIVDLGADGRYDLRREEGLVPQAAIRLRTPSAQMFFGAGEEISGGGLQPEALRGGFFLRVASAATVVMLKRVGNQIEYRVESCLQSPRNAFSSWPILNYKTNKSEQDGGGQPATRPESI